MLLRTVVLGAGVISKSHFKAINQTSSFIPVAVADIDKEKAQEFSQSFGVKPYEDYKQMIQEQKPDVAVITLPHFLHKEAALYCIQMNCHVLLEKPMAMNTAECDEIIAAAKANQVELMVGHTQHYIASNIKAKEIIEEEDLGQLVMVNDFRHVDYFRETRPDWFLQKNLSGGGIIMNLGSHSIDKIQWITSSTIRSVKAKLSYLGDRGNVEGSGCLYLETHEGVPITIAQSGYKSMIKDETEFIFTKGTIRLNTGKRSVEVIKNGEAQMVENNPLLSPIELQYQELFNAIQNVSPLTCTGDYAKSIIRIIEAVYESDHTGQEILL